MAKGKKYSAAEKHFNEKCIEWRHRIRDLEQLSQKYFVQCQELKEENDKLLAENERLKEDNKTLLKLNKMSEEELRSVVKSKESVNKVADLVNIFGGFKF